jgi:hypothetical protein
MYVSISTVSKSQLFKPLRLSSKLCRVAAAPLPMQLAAVNFLSNKDLMTG